jgi:hypothetical protein
MNSSKRGPAYGFKLASLEIVNDGNLLPVFLLNIFSF